MFVRSGIRVGRLFGIQIMLDWSLIVIFMLVTFSLGAGAFPAWHPDWSPALIWGVALAAAALFFVSILLHELSHALVAKAFGIPVNRITLFLFGGIANIEHDPDSPKKEALMAVVGPATSIGLGIGFSVLGALLLGARLGTDVDPATAVRAMGPVTTLLFWLGPVNVLLGLFNMLPGFPLDGGRVLRAALWAATHDLRKATRWASRVGQGFGLFLITIGIAMAFGFALPVLGGGLINGLWLAFIGWFLNGAAAASYRQLVIREALEDVPLARLMRRTLPPAVPASASIAELVEGWVMQHDEPMFPVVDGERIVGFARVADVRRVPRSEWGSRGVSEITTDLSKLPVAQASGDAFQAMKTLGQGDAEAILVVDQDRIAGIVRTQDIARWLSLEAQEELGPGMRGGWRRPAHR